MTASSEPPNAETPLDREVRARKRAEEARARSDRRFQTLFETMAQGVVYRDREGVIIAANPAAQRLLGLSAERLLGHKDFGPRWDLCRDDGSDLPAEENPSSVALRTGRPVVGQIVGVRNPLGDGTRWLKVNAMPQFRSGETEPYVVYTIFDDITDQRRAEEALRKSEARLGAIIGSAMDAIITTNGDQTILSVNETAEEVFGYSAAEMLGQSLSLLLPERLRARHADLFSRFADSGVSSRRMGSLPILVARRSDGTELPIEATISRLKFGDETLCTVIARDVTERMRAESDLRESEQRLRLAMESGRFGSWETDMAEKRLLSITETCRRHYGFADRETVTREELYQAIHPDDVERVRASVERTMAETGSVEVEFRVIWPDGSIHWLHSQGRVIETEDGCPTSRIVGMIEDITERREKERALREKDEVLRTVLSGAPLVLWATDTDGVFTISEGKALESLDQRPGEKVGRSIFDLYRRSPIILDSTRKALSGESVSYDVSVRDHAFHSELRPLRDARTGEIIGTIGVAIDISERRHIELALEQERQALRESEAQLEEAQRIAHVGSWEYVIATGERRWSPEMYRIVGIDPADGPPNDERLRTLYHPDDWNKRETMLAQMRETGQPVELDIRGIRPNGDLRWCRLTAEIVYGPNRTPERIIGTVADITDRVQSEERFRLVFQQSGDAKFLLDADTRRVVDCNESALRLLGVPTRASVLGRDITDFSPEFQPDGTRSDQSRPEVAEALDRGEQIRREWTHQRPDGSEVPVETMMSLVKIGGTRLLLCISRDLTERRRAEAALRQSEQRLRFALESAELGTWDLDLQSGAFVSVDERVKTLFGAAPDAPFTWNDCRKAIFPEDLARFSDAIAWAVKNRAATVVEYRIRSRGDGALRWLSTHGGPITDGHGGVGEASAQSHSQRIVCVTQDITERRQRENERDAALQEAQERADCDPLTGLLNHRAFQLRLDEEAVRAEREGHSLALVVLDLDNFKFFNDVYGHSVGDEVLRRVTERLESVFGGDRLLSRYGGDEFAVLIPDVASASPADIEDEMRAAFRGLSYQPPGAASPVPITASLGAWVYQPGIEDAVAARQEAVDFADERLRRAKSGADVEGEAQRIRTLAGGKVDGFTMLDALVAAVDNKDRYTRRHSEDVMSYSLTIARELGLDERTQETIMVAALLHDVGKIGIPDAILRKPGSLDDLEVAAIRQHAPMGAVIVGSVPGLESIVPIVRHHHERWDGLGYPSGLSGEETPLAARLMAVADAFSAMTTNRPYRRGLPPREAMSILNSGAGTQWDPRCVAAFVGAMQRA